jgi:hypothetical protein
MMGWDLFAKKDDGMGSRTCVRINHHRSPNGLVSSSLRLAAAGAVDKPVSSASTKLMMVSEP